MSNAIQKLPPAVEVIAMRRDRIIAQLPAHISKDRFFEALQSSYADAGLANCTLPSLLACAYTVAKLGLETDKVLGHVYIIPYGGVATIQLGYKGLIELARRSGIVLAVETEIAYEGDKWERWNDEGGKHIRHVPNDERDANAKPKLVYCTSQLANGARSQVEVMLWADVMKIKAKAGKSQAWASATEEMARKTVVRRASKYWPQSPELGRAVHIDEQLERGETQSLVEVEGIELPEAPRKRSLIAPDAPGLPPEPKNDLPPVQPLNLATVGKDNALRWLKEQCPSEVLEYATQQLGLTDYTKLSAEELEPLVDLCQTEVAEMANVT